MLLKTVNFCETAGVAAFSMHEKIDDNSFIYTRVVNGMMAVQITAGSPPVEEREERFKYKPGKLKLLSGMVTRGVIKTEEIEEPIYDQNGVQIGAEKKERSFIEIWYPTQESAKQNKLNTGPQESERLVVAVPNAMSSVWGPPPKSKLVFAQTQRARPYQYSGIMPKIIQVLLGWGKVDWRLFAEIDPETEEAIKTPYLKQVEGKGVEILYDHQFYRTHTMYTAGNGDRWLVEVSQARGVLAMPMPMVPGSDKPKFAEEYKGDRIITRVLDDLGFLPTGEPFPANINKAIEEGRVIRLAPASALEQFYKNSPFSIISGWSFNTRGSEAYNTGFRYDDDDVFQKSVLYKLKIQISGFTKDWEVGKPIGRGSATCTRVREGLLRSTKFGLPAKIYDPIFDACISHQALPHRDGRKPIRDARFNGPIWAGFMNDDAYLAYYFLDSRSRVVSEGYNTGEGMSCTLNETIQWEQISGSQTLSGGMVTNDFDFRTIHSEHISGGTSSSKFMGLCKPNLGHNPVNPSQGFVTQSGIYRIETKTYDKGGEGSGMVFMVPRGYRDAYYFWHGTYYSKSTSTHGVSTQNVGTPYVAFTWRKLRGYGLSGTDYPEGTDVHLCGDEHSEDRVVNIITGNTDCVAPGGPPAGMCEDVSTLNSKSGGCPHVFTFNKPADHGVDFKGEGFFKAHGVNGTKRFPVDWSEWNQATLPSPTEFGTFQSIVANGSAFGEFYTYTLGLLGEAVVQGRFPGTIPERHAFSTPIGVLI